MMEGSGYGKIKKASFKNQGHAYESYFDHSNSVFFQLSNKSFSVVPSLPFHTVLSQPLEKSSMNIKANIVPETREHFLNYGPSIK